MKRQFAAVTLCCIAATTALLLTGCPPAVPGWRYDLAASSYSARALPSPDGGFFVAGSARPQTSQAGYSQPLIARIDSAGKLSWHQFLDTHTTAIGVVTPAGDLLAAIAIGTSRTDTQLHVLKFTPEGTIANDTAYGLQGEDHLYPISAISTNDGGCIIAGWSQAGGSGHPFLLKIGPEGGTVWERHLLADSLGVIASKLIATNDGGFALTGRDGAYHGRLLRLDAQGNLLWWRQFDQFAVREGFPVALDQGGGFILAGTLDGLHQPQVIRTDADGNTVSTATYPGEAFSWGPFARGYTVTGIVSDQDGRAVLTGVFWFFWDWYPMLTYASTENGYLLRVGADNQFASYTDLGRGFTLKTLSATTPTGYIGAGERKLRLVLLKGEF